MYETLIETTARNRWNGVFTTNERIIDEKEKISKLELGIAKNYILIGQEKTRTPEEIIKMAEILKEKLWLTNGLKITINKNIKERVAYNPIYIIELLIMKRPEGDELIWNQKALD